MKAAPAQFGVGDAVFVNHPEHSWVAGRVDAVAANTARVVSTKKHSAWVFRIKVNDPDRQCTGLTMDNIDEWNVTHCDESSLNKTTDDLLQLTHLHDATLLRCLYLRYMTDVVYTNIGAIIIALNPFNYTIPHYMEDRMPKYLAESVNGHIRDKLLPHCWTQAHNTYMDMKVDNGNQCILISGESGAGKTESTKIVMKYLSKVSAMGLEGERKATAESVLQNLVACSPVLESFGNARTVRNDNSSRFGKLMKVKFDDSNVIMGAFTTKYLLEKSRIVTAAQNERVYHSFYLALRSNDHHDVFLFTQPPETYKSVNSGNCLDNSEFSTAAEYTEVCNCMLRLGMPKEVVVDTFKIASFVVHQSNINFVADGEGSKVAAGADGEYALWAAASLLGVDPDVLVEEYTSTTMMIMGESVRKKLSKVKAVDVRDAFSKAVYDALFSTLVDRCNESCDVKGTTANPKWIALLDIFGFEDFEKNSFEQLCINLANESLQGHYNEFIFKKDMEECRKEGIDVVDVVCPDNTPCIQLVAANGGILALLDDECALGKGTDLAFLDSVILKFDNHAFFARKKTSKDTFIVKHYAGDVTYDVNGWLEKNRDTLKPELQQCLTTSKNVVAVTLFKDAAPVQQQPAKKSTVGMFFRRQLDELMQVINSTNPHWIRCIKPHPAKKAKMFGGQYTITQLESSGVLGTVKIRKAGYPVRYTHKAFALKFLVIAPTPIDAASWPPAKWKAQATLILTKVEMLNKAFAQIGQTLVFLKADAYPALEKKKMAFARNLTILFQRVGRGYMKRLRAFRSQQARRIQRVCRGIMGRYQMFVLYCDRHRERIEQERLEKAARQRWIDELEKSRGAIMREEHHARSSLVAEESSTFQGFYDELEQIVANIAEAKRLAEMAEEQRNEEIRRAFEREERNRILSQLLAPARDAESDDRRDIEAEEMEYRHSFRRQELFRRLELIFRNHFSKLSHTEMVARAAIEKESVEDHSDWKIRLSELRQMHEMKLKRASLDAALQEHRARRAREVQAQLQRASQAHRSLPERILLPSDHVSHVGGTARLHSELNDPSLLAVDVSPERLRRELREAAAEKERFADDRLQSAAAAYGVKSAAARLRSVELYCRVYSPQHHCKGTVVALAPYRRFVPQSFQVRLDTGAEVWLDLDDVTAADDDDTVPTMPASSPSRRLLQPQHTVTVAASSPPREHRGSSSASPRHVDTIPYPLPSLKAEKRVEESARTTTFETWQRQLEADAPLIVMVNHQSPTLERIRVSKPPSIQTLKELPSPTRDWSHSSSPRRLGGWQRTATALESINSLLSSSPTAQAEAIPDKSPASPTSNNALPQLRPGTSCVSPTTGGSVIPRPPATRGGARPKPEQLNESLLGSQLLSADVVAPPHLSPERAAAYRYNKLPPWDKSSLWRAMRSDQVAWVYSQANAESPTRLRTPAEADMDAAVGTYDAKSPSRFFARQIRSGSPPTTTDHRGEHHHVSSKRRIVDPW